MRFITLLRSMVFLFLFCTTVPRVQAETNMVTLKQVRLVETGLEVHIAADKPLTYTYYRMPELLKVVLDLALVEPGQVPPVITGSGLISKITVEKKDITTFSLTRVLITLDADADFAVLPDAADRSKLIISFRPRKQATAAVTLSHPKPAASTVTSIAAPVSSAVPVIFPAATPAGTPGSPAVSAAPDRIPVQKPALPVKSVQDSKPVSVSLLSASKPALQPVAPHSNGLRGINSIKIINNTLAIRATSPIEDYRAFTLKNPGRLVIDIPLTKGPMAVKEFPLHSLGIAKARLGNYPDKIRVVFDTRGDQFPPYRIDSSANGLNIVLPKSDKKTEIGPLSITMPAP